MRIWCQCEHVFSQFLNDHMQVDRLCLTVDTPPGVLGENRISVCLSLRYYASEASNEHQTLEYCCTCALLPGYDEDGRGGYTQYRHTLVHFLPDERPATGAHTGDNAGYKTLFEASKAPRDDWLAVIAELNAGTLR